jgi:hypothetical protein
MKYAFEMGSCASHSKLNSRVTQTAWWSHKPTFIFYFFLNKESMLRQTIVSVQIKSTVRERKGAAEKQVGIKHQVSDLCSAGCVIYLN